MNRLKMLVWIFTGGLIILQMIMVAIIVHGESLTFDEGDHIFAGYMMWHGGDYGLNSTYAQRDHWRAGSRGKPRAVWFRTQKPRLEQ